MANRTTKSTKPEQPEAKTTQPKAPKPELQRTEEWPYAKAVQPKAETPKTTQPETQPQTPPAPKPTRSNPRYEGSIVQQWDNALLAGGTWADIAKQVGKTAGVIRAHVKFRVKGGKWRLVEDGDRVTMVPA
jgi:hypothetical protein